MLKRVVYRRKIAKRGEKQMKKALALVLALALALSLAACGGSPAPASSSAAGSTSTAQPAASGTMTTNGLYPGTADLRQSPITLLPSPAI